MIAFDEYVLDVLMRDLVGHDRSPSAFLVYLHLWSACPPGQGASAQVSLTEIAGLTGLSKSAVQNGLRILLRRKLLRVQRASATAVPEYRVLRPWQR